MRRFCILLIVYDSNPSHPFTDSGVYPEDEPIIDTGVYFSANLSKHWYFHLDKPILFDHVISNDGNAYDPETGEFTTPLKGRYMFTVTIRAQFNKEVCAEITRNDKMLGRLSAEYGRIDKASGSMTIVVELEIGDIVKVTHYAVKCGDYFGNGFTAFSGFLFD